VLWPNGTVRHLESIGRVSACSDEHMITVRGLTLDITDRPE
jgi:hypothetical protein